MVHSSLLKIVMESVVSCACITLALLGAVVATPAKQVEAEASGSFKIPPLLTFDNGNVGVNFLGFKASAGLGGLLTGDMSQGGLHAEAETPFGQKAGAGLGGRVDGSGKSAGGLYAGATAGGGVGAGAGLDGIAGAEGSMGRSYAGASAGGVSKTVIKEKYGGPSGSDSFATAGSSAGAEGSFGASFGFKKSVNVNVAPPAAIVKPAEVEFVEVEETPLPPPKKTYIERTVIPNYVEKTIQVPSYVEKTIRVPTVVEKKVRVAAAPTIIEKTVEVPPPEVDFKKSVVVEKQVAPSTVVIEKTKTKFRRRPWLHLRKRINIGNLGSYEHTNGASAAGGGFGASSSAFGGFAGGAYGTAGASGTAPHGAASETYTATFRKTANPQLIKDIFNIPIATLGAVSNLVGGIAGGTSGSLSVSKSIQKSY